MFDLDRLEQAVSSDKPEEKLFVKHCREYDLDPSLLHTVITRNSDNTEFEITGLSKKGRAAWVLLKSITSKNIQDYPVDIRKIHKLYSF